MSEFVGRNGVHDLGGLCLPELDNQGVIDRKEKALKFWEVQTHALLVILACKSPPLTSTDELRRAVEALEPRVYREWSYYAKWAAALTKLMLERGVIEENELQNALAEDERKKEKSGPRFNVGDRVRVRPERTRVRWRRPHLRVPGYIFGQEGEVVVYVGEFKDPSFLAFRAEAPQQALYVVRFSMGQVFPAAPSASASDLIELEVYEDWLDSCSAESSVEIDHEHHHHAERASDECGDHSHEHEHDHVHENSRHDHKAQDCPCGSDHDHHSNTPTSPGHHEHGHEHEHEHSHHGRIETEQQAVDKEGQSDPGEIIFSALLGLLQRKQIVSAEEVRIVVGKLESTHEKMRGADLVVRAWKDATFKQRLLANPAAAALELGIVTSNPNAPTVLRVIANSATEHHVIVCTLCSCYPQALLGFSPAWYKSRNYRARVVRQPREVLREFGLVVGEEKRIVVHDSTADCRYMVLPEPPAQLSKEEIEDMTEEELRKYVTRDSMIGVAVL